MSNIIQFKRSLNFRGTYEEARTALTGITIEEGEPILVSYMDNTDVKYFLCLGLSDGASIILPTYSSIDELNDNINTEISKILSTYKYDWVADIDTENSNVTFYKDETTGVITVNYIGSGDTSSFASEMETVISGASMTQQEFNELVISLLTWNNITT